MALPLNTTSLPYLTQSQSPQPGYMYFYRFENLTRSELWKIYKNSPSLNTVVEIKWPFKKNIMVNLLKEQVALLNMEFIHNTCFHVVQYFFSGNEAVIRENMEEYNRDEDVYNMIDIAAILEEVRGEDVDWEME